MNDRPNWLRMGPLLGAVALTGLLCAPAGGEVIYLKDGTVREGEIIRKDDDGHFLVLKVDQQGITATMRIDYEDILRIAERPTSGEERTDEYNTRLQNAEAEQNPALFEALGDWCARYKMFKEALEAFTRAAEIDEEHGIGPRIKISQVRIQQGRPDLARHALEALRLLHPEHPLVTALLADLDEQAEKVARELTGLAIDRFRRERHDDSIAILNRLQRIRDPKVFERANAESRRVLGWTVAELLATNRIQRRCLHCSPQLRDGLVVCPTCKGKCFFEKTVQDVEVIEGKNGQPPKKRIFSRVVRKPCPQCRGFGYVLCPHCHGAGRDFGDIGDLERPVFVSMLRDEVDRMAAHLSAYLDGPTPLEERVPLLKVNAEPILLGCRRLEYFLGHTFMLDAGLRGETLHTYVRLRQQVGALARTSSDLYEKRTLDDVARYDAKQLERLIILEGILLPGPGEPDEPE